MRERLDLDNGGSVAITVLSINEVSLVVGGQGINEVINKVEGDIKSAESVMKEAGEVVKETEKAVGFVNQALEGLGIKSKYAKPAALGIVGLFGAGIIGTILYFRCRGGKTKAA